MQKNRRIHQKYRADTFENGFSVFVVPKNPIVATRILALSAIGAKLATPPTTNGRHLGFWAPEAKDPNFFLGNFLICNQYIYTVLKNARNQWVGGGAHMVFLPPPLMGKLISSLILAESSYFCDQTTYP